MGFEQPEDASLVARLTGYRPPVDGPLVSADLVRDSEMAEALLGVYAAELR